MQHAVDEERGRAGDPGLTRAALVERDALGVHAVGDLPAYAFAVEPDRRRVCGEIVEREPSAAGVELVVHRPERALGAGRLGGLRGVLGVGVHGQRHVPEGEAQAAVEFLIAVLFAAAVLVRLADLISIPYPIVLVIGGVAIGFVPGLPDIALEPDAVFLLFLPPLLHASGFGASAQELRAAAAQLVSLTFALVLVTMCAVAVAAHEAIGLSWAAAFVLGAILAPTDPVSAAATFSRLGAPERVAVAVEAEAMLNDAAALVAYRVAAAAAVAGTFALDAAAWEFVRTAAGGVLVGLAVGFVGERLQRRLSDVPLAIFLSVLFAYGAYIGAEQIGASGVLATVIAGVWFGWRSHEMFDADTRLSAIAFWQVLVFGLNTTLFVLLGLQFEGILDDARAGSGTGDLLVDVAIVSAVVVGVRLAWVGIVPLLTRVIPAVERADTGDDWRERLVVGWSGMRGAISLAAALALSERIEQRELLIFVTVGVIAVTLVGQGLTLGPLMRRLRIEGERAWSPDEAIGRLEAAQAALDRLDELEREGRINGRRSSGTGGAPMTG